MKKILILILIVLLGMLCYNVVTKGYEVADLKILSLEEIKGENENLDNTIAQVDELKQVRYPAKISELNTEAKKMMSNKKTYEELATYSSEQDVINATQTEKYDIEVLWVRIGNHAEKCGVVPKLEVLSSSNNTTDANDLRITATGSYIGITDFIREIEDDAKLGFAIENFELVPASNSETSKSQATATSEPSKLQATFKIKDIFLNPNTTTSNLTANDIPDNDIPVNTIQDKEEKSTTKDNNTIEKQNSNVVKNET